MMMSRTSLYSSRGLEYDSSLSSYQYRYLLKKKKFFSSKVRGLCLVCAQSSFWPSQADEELGQRPRAWRAGVGPENRVAPCAVMDGFRRPVCFLRRSRRGPGFKSGGLNGRQDELSNQIQNLF